MSSTPHPIVYAGTFERVMDAKHRVTVPAAWLGDGPNDFHVIPSPLGECLIIMPPEEFNQIEARINQSSASPTERRKAIRQFYSQARAISADAQGRLLFPDEHCSRMKLKGEVVLVGSRSRFEIWSAEQWAIVAKEEHAAFRDVAALIGL
jgi:MraZ protein